MILIEKLNITYDHKQVLKDLSCHLQEGCIHGFAGLNGSGKTSLLNAIAGYLKPDSGTILLHEKKIQRSQLSYLEAQNYFYSNITGGEYLSLFSEKNGTFALPLWQELFQLPLQELISGYSVGMKKKLALLAVFKLNKSVLILDEPFNGLDIEAIYILKTALARYKEKGKTILLTSHLFDTLSDVCDYIHHINHQKVEASFAKKDFAKLENILLERIKQKTDELVERAVDAAFND
jgi:ABC-2 type transport system ATP-binding protein